MDQEAVYRREGQEDQVDQEDLEAHHQEWVDQVVQADNHQAEDHHQAILNTEDHHQAKVAHHQDIHSTEAHHQAAQEVHKVNQTHLAEDDYNNEYK